MFPKLVVLLCAAYVPMTCSQAIDECFPNVTANVSKVWRHTEMGDNYLSGARLFDKALEEQINKQINYELSAHYTYLSMSYYFDQDNSYMPGFRKFFKKMAEEEHEHAQMFMKYQNKRGGKVYLNSIPRPCKDGKWLNGTVAMKEALKLEIKINQYLLNLHKAGKEDPQFLDFLETNFLSEQVDSIKEISNYVNILLRLNSELGEYQFDKLTLGGGKE